MSKKVRKGRTERVKLPKCGTRGRRVNAMAEKSRAANGPFPGCARRMHRARRTQRILLRMLEVIYFQVDVQFGPVQMIAVQQLDVLDGAEDLVAKVGVLLVAEKVLSGLHEEPDPERRNILNAYGNSCATL
jgi:hypothetical protein